MWFTFTYHATLSIINFGMKKQQHFFAPFFRRETRNYNFLRQREIEDMSQQIRRILLLLESGGLSAPDETDAGGGGSVLNTPGVTPRKVSRASAFSATSNLSTMSLFGEEPEEDGDVLDEFTLAQLSARRRSTLGRIVEAGRKAALLFPAP
jgi:hypothetical protein